MFSNSTTIAKLFSSQECADHNVISSKKFRRHAGSGHCLQAVYCKSPGGFSANEKEEKNASNDNSYFSWKALGNDIASWPVESHTNLINLLAPTADIFATFY